LLMRAPPFVGVVRSPDVRFVITLAGGMARGGSQAQSGFRQVRPRAGAGAADGRKRSKVRQIRVSPEEDARLERIAAAKGISVSELLRDGALRRRVPARGAAELERAGVSCPPSAGSGSAASPASAASGAFAPAGAAAVGGASAAVAVFRCPVGGCGPEGELFEARSPAVKCPAHGERVVPA